VPAEGVFGEAGAEFRQALAQYPPDAVACLRIGRKKTVEFVNPFRLGRIAVDRGHALQFPGFAEEVHRRPVGQRRDYQSDDVGQRGGIIERGGEHAAGFGEEGEPLFGGACLGAPHLCRRFGWGRTDRRRNGRIIRSHGCSS